MKKDYIVTKKQQNKKATSGVWIIFVLIGAFALIAARFALSGSDMDSPMNMFNGLPSSDAAYNMAQQFVRPTLRSSEVTFASDGYHFAKMSDSVYLIKSYAETPIGDGVSQKEYFKVIIKYKGGSVSNKMNWELLDLRSNY